MSNEGDKTFVKITNKDVYEKLLEIEKMNNLQHQELKGHVIATNGKVKANRWMITTIGSLLLLLLGWFLQHVSNTAG